MFFPPDGYTVSDVLMYWKPTPVSGVEEAELPQFTILGYETNDRKVFFFVFSFDDDIPLVSNYLIPPALSLMIITARCSMAFVKFDV